MNRAWVFGDNVSTDYIIPGRFNISTNVEELRKHTFKYIRPEFADQVEIGDVVIGGRNFGCGSSREHAAIVLKACGVHLVAESYGWIFKRNCINTGILPLTASGNLDVKDGDYVVLDFNTHTLKNLSIDKVYNLMKPPKLVLEVYKAGGLIKYLNMGKTYQS
jgi:3-isopropylmalate/(R)-2-methylmalate dehydratase small subunit